MFIVSARGMALAHNQLIKIINNVSITKGNRRSSINSEDKCQTHAGLAAEQLQRKALRATAGTEVHPWEPELPRAAPQTESRAGLVHISWEEIY